MGEMIVMLTSTLMIFSAGWNSHKYYEKISNYVGQKGSAIVEFVSNTDTAKKVRVLTSMLSNNFKVTKFYAGNKWKLLVEQGEHEELLTKQVMRDNKIYI